MGVYGPFLSAFPELLETIGVLTKDGVRHKIRAAYIPSKGDGIDRKNEGTSSWVGDIATSDNLVVGRRYLSKIDIGSYVYRAGEVYKAVKKQDYDRTGSFAVFELQRVQGASLEQDGRLTISEGTYK